MNHNKYWYVPAKRTQQKFNNVEPFDVLGFTTFEVFEKFLRSVTVRRHGNTQAQMVGGALAAVGGQAERLSNDVFDLLTPADMDPESIWLHVDFDTVVIMLQKDPANGSANFRQEVETVAMITAAWGMANKQICIPESAMNRRRV
jgi:hypothetical protein